MSTVPIKRVKSLAWPAPAKLNLFLYINHKRDDGYHELQTLFQFIELCDWLDFRVTDNSDLILHSNVGATIADEDNLIIKAAKLLQSTANCQQGAEIWLDKQLPMGGGIGGGSSDAATTLVALNALWGTGLSSTQLQALGLTLGADVPVFINGLAVIAEGIGEHFHPVTPPEPWYLLLTPDVHVSTADVFQSPELTRDTPKRSVEQLLSMPWKNDCQTYVAKTYPNVGKNLVWLLEYAPSRMTGTGASVFAQFDTLKQAETIYAKLPKGIRGSVAKGTNISPLITRLAQFKASTIKTTC